MNKDELEDQQFELAIEADMQNLIKKERIGEVQPPVEKYNMSMVDYLPECYHSTFLNSLTLLRFIFLTGEQEAIKILLETEEKLVKELKRNERINTKEI